MAVALLTGDHHSRDLRRAPVPPQSSFSRRITTFCPTADHRRHRSRRCRPLAFPRNSLRPRLRVSRELVDGSACPGNKGLFTPAGLRLPTSAMERLGSYSIRQFHGFSARCSAHCCPGNWFPQRWYLWPSHSPDARCFCWPVAISAARMAFLQLLCMPPTPITLSLFIG